MKRPTIADLAREAGVGVATVDRVLSGRTKVREETALKVHEAARRIGFHGVNAIRNRILADLPELHVGIVLQKERHEFYRNFSAEIDRALLSSTTHRIRLTTKFAQSTMPSEVAELLASFNGKVNAVAATGVDHHLVTEAVSDLRGNGIPTFSLLSDFAQGVRENYIGMNNIKAGRAVAWLMAQMTPEPGKVAAFIGGYRFHGHELRETGFRSALREYAPQHEVLSTQINLETRQLTHEATADLLEKHPDMAGIYCVGGGMEGAISALRELREPGEVRLIVNELTKESREALLDQTVSIVLTTPLRQLCEELKLLVIHTAQNGLAETPGQKFLPFSLLTPESV